MAAELERTFKASSSGRPGGASATNLPLYFSAVECVHRSAHVLSMLSVQLAASAQHSNATSRAHETAMCLLSPAMLANQGAGLES